MSFRRGGSRRPATGIFGACLTVSRRSFVATDCRHRSSTRVSLRLRRRWPSVACAGLRHVALQDMPAGPVRTHVSTASTSHACLSGGWRLRQRHSSQSWKSADARFPRRVRSPRSGCGEVRRRFVPRDTCRIGSASTRRASGRTTSRSRFPARSAGAGQPIGRRG